MLNLGIIGTNWITHSYVECAQATGKWTLGAVYSRKQETAQEFASKYPGQKISLYTNLDSFVADPNISTVYIASPNILHYTHAALALRAGKHVILEKPSCSTVQELETLFQIAKEKGVILIEAFRHTQEANFKLLQRLLPTLGQIYGCSITFAQYSSRYDKVLAGETPNIFNLDMGGGALVDLGVYPVAAAIALFGPPTDVQYFPTKIATGADGAGQIILTYPTFSAYLCHSKIYNSDAPSEIYTEKGTLKIGGPGITDIDSLILWDPRTKQRKDVDGVSQPEKLNLKEEAEEHARCILEKDMEKVKEYEGLSREVLRVLEKCRRDNGLLFPGGI